MLIFTCRLRKKSADGNANTRIEKNSYLLQAIKRWKKLGIVHVYPNNSTHTYTIEYHRKAQIMGKKI